MDLSFPDETTTTKTTAKEKLISIDKMLEWFECAPKELTSLREVVIRDLVVSLRSDESDEYEILVKWEPIANDSEIRVKTEPIDSEQSDYNEIREAVVREFAVDQTINEPDNRGIENEMEFETDGVRTKNERISRVQFEYIGNESDDSQDEDYEPPRLRRGLSNDESSIGAQNQNRSIDAILKPFIDAQSSSFNESIENERRRKAKPKFQLNFSIQKSRKQKRIESRPKGQKISEITEKLKEKRQSFNDASTKNNVSEIVQNVPTSQLLSSQSELEDDRLNTEKNVIQSVVVPSTLILLGENTSMNIGPLQLNNHMTVDAIPNVTPVTTAIQPVQLQTSENQQQSQNIANINYRRTIIHRWLNQQNQQETTPFHEQCENAPHTDSMLESSTSSTSSNSTSSNSHVNQQVNQRAKSSTFPKENYNGRRSFKMNNCSVVVNSRYAKNSHPRSHSRTSGVIINPLLLNSSSSRLPSNNSFLPPKVVINPKLVDNPNMIADLHRNQMRVRSSFIGGEPVVVNPKFLK